MEILKITEANNKKFNGKNIFFDKNTGVGKMGRTFYTLDFGVHQPNMESGDYSVKDHTLETTNSVRLFNVNNKNSTGIIIYSFEITK
tara:strand:+ start:25054 stop:25314 length:261 start_codon:yes stop_codon:yes gene_type:complete